MPNVLQKFYSSFGGVDTRSNEVMSDPKTFRGGSKNFRYNFKDEIQNANGFQHKALSSFINLGDIEYKYIDPNTGESKLEFLCVGNDGLLYRKRSHYLKITDLGGFTNYSFYYDENTDDYQFQVIGSPTTLVITNTTDMTTLCLGLIGIGITCEIVDDDGITIINSLKLAYYIDVAIDASLKVDTMTSISSQYWEAVTYPSVGNFNTELPFVTSKNFYTSSEYEGISYVNLNNVCYITDGGFPMKYDGKVIARLGMAKILRPGGNAGLSGLDDRNLSGFIIAAVISSGGAVTPNKNFKYVFQHGYVDYQGSTLLGAFETAGTNLYMNVTTLNSNAISITHAGLPYNPNFPIFSCKVSADQDVLTAGGVINVYSEHNIQVGMLLRIPINNAIVGIPGFSYIMTYVSAVTATTLTVDFGQTGALYPFQEGPHSLVGSRTVGSNLVTGMGSATTGNYTLSSKVITAIPSTASFVTGDEVFSAYLAAGTKVVSIDSGTQITVDQSSSATVVGGAISVNYGVRVRVGALVTGFGIPASTYVTSINGSGSGVSLSNNSTTATTGALTFTNYSTLLITGQVLNGGYAQDVYKNKISTPNYVNGFCPDMPFGAFTRVFRTTGDGATPYRLTDLPLARSGGLQTFIDDFSDGPTADSLSRLALQDSDQGGELPRACKYLTTWQDQLVQAGRPVDPTIKDLPYPTSYYGTPTNIWGYTDTNYFGYIYSEVHLCDFQSIYWADALTPEGFPQDGLHEFLISTKSSDKIKGIAPNKDTLFALKERSTGVIVGSLSDNDLNLEILEDDIGCANHRTIEDVGGSLVWLDAVNGFYSCVAGRLPENIGFNISDYQKINSTKLDYNTAVAANFRKENLYICSVGSTTFVFDYASDGSLKRKCWYIWDRFSVKSLLATSNDELILNDGSYSWKMKTTNTKYDFTDHKSAIDMFIKTSWLTEEYPTVDKHYLNLWINSVQGGFTLDFYQYGNFLEDIISSIIGVAFKIESTAKKSIKESFKAAIPKLSGVSFGIRNNQKNQYVRIQGYEVQLSDDFDKGEPKR